MANTLEDASRWADLPASLLAGVAQHLSRPDKWAFRSVCHSWKSVAEGYCTMLSIFSNPGEHIRVAEFSSCTALDLTQYLDRTQNLANLTAVLDSATALPRLQRLDLSLHALRTRVTGTAGGGGNSAVHTQLVTERTNTNGGVIQGTGRWGTSSDSLTTQGVFTLSSVELPPVVGELSQLTSLSILSSPQRLPCCSDDPSGADLARLPPEVCQLSGLHTLIVHIMRLPRRLLPSLLVLQELQLQGFGNIAEACVHVWQLPHLHSLQFKVKGNNRPSQTQQSLAEAAYKAVGRCCQEHGRLRKFMFEADMIFIPPILTQMDQWHSLTSLHLHLGHLPKFSADFHNGVGTLTHLVCLDLRGNYLPFIPGGLHDMQHLTRLTLSGNGLTTLGLLPLPPQLAHLDVSSNSLCDLPEWLTTITGLQTLHVARNRFAAADSILPATRLPNLTFLDVSANRLVRLPDSLADLTALTYLSVRANRLESYVREAGDTDALPGSVPRLRELDVGLNHWKQLPDLLTWPAALTRLSVAGALTALPAGCADFLGGGVASLAELAAEGNSLDALPAAWMGLTNLTSLVVSRNQLEHLPADFSRLVCLRSLDAGRNRLLELPDALSRLTALESLTLQCNALIGLPPGLSCLVHLAHLDLHSNRLQSLPPCSFPLPSLQYLRLSSNVQLRAVPASLAECSRLQQLPLDSLLAEADVVRSLAAQGCEVLAIKQTVWTGRPLPQSVPHLESHPRVPAYLA